MLLNKAVFRGDISSGQRIVHLTIATAGMGCSRYSIRQTWRSQDAIESELEVMPGNNLTGVKVAMRESPDGSPLGIAVDIPGSTRTMRPSTSLSRVFGSEILYENIRFWLPKSATVTAAGGSYSRCDVNYDEWQAFHFYSDALPFPRCSRWSPRPEYPSINVHYCGLTATCGFPAPTAIIAGDGAGRTTRMTVASVNDNGDTKAGSVLCQSVRLGATPNDILGLFTKPTTKQTSQADACRPLIQNPSEISSRQENIFHQLLDSDSQTFITFLWRLTDSGWPASVPSICTVTLKQVADTVHVRLLQSGIPHSLVAIVQRAWSVHYWRKLALLAVDENYILSE